MEKQIYAGALFFFFSKELTVQSIVWLKGYGSLV